jgi:hypothetical protein
MSNPAKKLNQREIDNLFKKSELIKKIVKTKGVTK